MQRWIIHIDMDAFYAAVEQRDNPDFFGKPVIVGGLSSRGVVATASYEARKFGIHSAMAMVEARRRCPQGIFVTPNHGCYEVISAQIRAILHRYSPLVEPLSLDEAFLDVSGMEWIYPDPVEMARKMKDDIKRELDLTASAGVSFNKFLAKLASDMQKPDGLVVIRPGEETRILHNLPVGKLWGVGELTAAALEKKGIRTSKQLAETDPKLLELIIGKSAYELSKLARGEDSRPVMPEQPPKSVGNEETFEDDLLAWDDIEKQLLSLAGHVGWRLRRIGLAGQTVTVKVRFASFRTLTRSRTMERATNIDEILYQLAKELYKTVTITEGIRLLGLTVSNLRPEDETMGLFDQQLDKQTALHKTVDKLKKRFGEDVVKKGRLI